MTARRLALLGVVILVAAAAGAEVTETSAAREREPAPKTRVSIRGTGFLINGTRTYRGTALAGMLPNSRMIQAAFDDENRTTVTRWRYPDTGRWSADRNTREFVAAVPAYSRRGLKAVTVGLQGGSPLDADGFRGDRQSPLVSAFRRDGSLKPAWLRRLHRIISACDRHGIVVIVSLFYFGQDHRLRDEAAVLRAVDNTTAWLLRRRYANVLVEIANEADLFYEHPVLRPDRINELIARVQRRSNRRLKVSTSFTSGHHPSESTIAQADFVLVHGNGEGPAGVRRIVDIVRSRQAFRRSPKPIVFNEDSTRTENMRSAVMSGASWGYYDQGRNNYAEGFQSPPVNWRLTTPQKLGFFDTIRDLRRR